MKKYIILDITYYVISLIAYILFLLLNKNREEFFYYESFVFYVGLMIPLIYLITILIKQLKIKEYIGSKNNSFMAYGIALVSGLMYMLIIHVISEEFFNKFHILFWTFEPLLYVIFITLGIFLEIRDKKKKKNLKFKINQ